MIGEYVLKGESAVTDAFPVQPGGTRGGPFRGSLSSCVSRKFHPPGVRRELSSGTALIRRLADYRVPVITLAGRGVRPRRPDGAMGSAEPIRGWPGCPATDADNDPVVLLERACRGAEPDRARRPAIISAMASRAPISPWWPRFVAAVASVAAAGDGCCVDPKREVYQPAGHDTDRRVRHAPCRRVAAWDASRTAVTLPTARTASKAGY